MSRSPRPSLRRRLTRRVLRPFVGPLAARRAAELEAETEGLRIQIDALEDKLSMLVEELQRLTERLVDSEDGQGTE